MADIPVMTLPANNQPGAGSFILIAEYGWFSTLSTPPTASAYGDEVTITDDHAFSTGKGFVRLSVEDELHEVMAPVVGGPGALALKPSIPLFLPDITQQNLWFAQQNKEYIVLCPVFGCSSDDYLQLGDACYPVKVRPADGMKTGKARSNDQRGVYINLESYGTPYIYSGAVDLYP